MTNILLRFLRPANIIRLALSVVFLVAGFTKLAHLEEFKQALIGFQLFPIRMLQPIAVIVAVLEIGIGCWLLTNRAPKRAAIASAILISTFLVVVILTLERNLAPVCGCFPGVADRPVSWYLVVQDALLLAGAVFITYQSSHSQHLAIPRVRRTNVSGDFAPSGLESTFDAKPFPNPSRRQTAIRSTLVLVIALITLGASALALRELILQSRRAGAEEGPASGEQLPEFMPRALVNGVSDGGNQLRFNDRDILLVFIKADCVYCRASLPEIEKLYIETIETHNTNLRILLISESDAEQTTALIGELRISAPVFLDHDDSMHRKFHLQHTPALLWYSGGTLQHKAIGSEEISKLESNIRQTFTTRSDIVGR